MNPLQQGTLQAPNQPPQLDQDAVNLAKAIRQTESNGNFQARGKSGEVGGYQFMPETWRRYSKQYLGRDVPIESATPEEQNEVAYKRVKEWKDKGYNPGQIASMWNAGEGAANAYQDPSYKGVNDKGVEFDVPAYAAKVAQAYHQFKGQPTAAQTPEGLTGNAYPVDLGRQGVAQQTGQKTVGGFLGNVGKSAANVIGSTVEAIVHPIQTGKALVGTGVGFAQKLIPGEQKQERYADALIGYAKDRYGSGQAIKDTLYNDPVGALLDASTAVTGGGAAASKLGALSKAGKLADVGEAVSSVGRAIDPISVAGGLKSAAADATKGIRSKAAARIEESNLRLTPTQKGKLIKDNVFNTPESSVDRTANISDSDVVRYGAERRVTGSPEERMAKHQDVLDDFEKQIDRATENSSQTVPKEEVIRGLDALAETFAGQPETYDAVRSVMDRKISHIQSKIKGDVLTMKEVQRLKKDAWNASKFDAAVPSASRIANRTSGHLFKNIIEDAFEKGGETIFGRAPSDFNKEYGTAIAYQKLLEKAVGRNEMGVGGRAISAFAGNKLAETLGLGPVGELIGTAAGESLGRGLLGTSNKSKAASFLQGGLQEGMMTKLARGSKKAVKPGFYAGEIRERAEGR